MFLFSPGNDKQWYSPTVSVSRNPDADPPLPAVVYPGPHLREMPYFSNRESTNEPRRSEVVVQATPDNPTAVYAGHHYSVVDRYAQQGVNGSLAWGNAPYWRYTGFYRNPPKFMQVDCSAPGLQFMSFEQGTLSIGSQNKGKLLFRRFDGESYSSDGSAFGGTNNPDVAMWVSYRPIYNITEREELTYDDSGLSLNFRYFYQTNFINTGASGDYAPPCWYLHLTEATNDDYHDLIFLPATYIDVFDGVTSDLRKWYSSNHPEPFPQNFEHDQAISVTSAPPQVGIFSFPFDGGVAWSRNGECHGHQSPYQETEYVFANFTFEHTSPNYVNHTPNTVKGFPKIKVVPVTL